MRNIFFFGVIILILSSCNEPKSDIQYYPITNHWEFLQEGDSLWKPATIPGTVQTDLLKLGEIPHPFIGNNEDSIQWISEKNWLYKTSFTVPKTSLKKEKHLLEFEGLDTYAHIFLNDSLIGKTHNAFRGWEFDISSIIKVNNELKIKFFSVDSIETKAENALAYTLPESPRVFTRKPQYQYGWDWGPRIKTMGITNVITLTSYSNFRCKDVYLNTHNITDSIAHITAELTIQSQKEENIKVTIHNKNTQEQYQETLSIQPSKTQYQIPFSIKNPKRWWTHNLGEPFLYDIDITIELNDKPHTSFSKKLGIRTVELITEKDSIGESFYFKLNGKPVYMKGANYIPQNVFLPEVNQDKYLQLINDVVDTNMNMLRVWGGGVYENNFFYQLCDANGVLVWQDFMFACAMYPGDDAFLENVKQEAIENVKRLRQHPSIALWCGNNENSEGWHRWGWKDGKTENQKQEIWNGYYAVFNHILPQVVDSLHPSVSYWESSPKFGRGDKRYQFEGDAHDWWVWHDGYPFEHFEGEVPRFMSEFGFQSFPSYEAIQYFTEQDRIDLNHPSFANHQKHSRGFSLIKEYMERDFPVPIKGADYVYMSQLVQAYGMTKGIYAHRRAKPYNMGTLYWQLNDCWPAVSWSSIDGLDNWKAFHYQAKKAFENIILSTYQKENEVEVFIVNDTFTEINDTLKVSHQDFNGNTFFKEVIAYNSPINSSKIAYIFDITKKEYEKENSFLKLTYGDAQYFHYFSKPKNLSLENKPIDLEITQNQKGYLIRLTSKTLQKNVFLHSKEKGIWTDNYFDLLPGISKEIQFKTSAKNKPNIQYKTLNQFVQD